MKTLVDSNGWIEFFADGPLADRYAPFMAHPKTLVTPTMVLLEVYKWIKRERGEDLALETMARMKETEIVPLNDSLALAAADAALTHKLALADAVVYATAQSRMAKLVTSDADLKGLPGVTYHPKKGN